MRKFKKLPMLLLSATVLAGCSGQPAQTESTAEPTTAVETTAETTTAAETIAETETEDPFANLTLNEYEGLEITAAVLPRTAIIPGSTIPVSVAISNNGEKTISYVQGSGSFSTPQAISLSMDGLQTILPADHLGIATMDYVTKELKPGETLNLTLNVKAIAPNDNFDNYSFDLFNSKQLYIGDMDIAEMFETYTDLTPAVSGVYEGMVTFVYHTIEDAETETPFGDPTGYSQAPVTISVTE